MCLIKHSQTQLYLNWSNAHSVKLCLHTRLYFQSIYPHKYFTRGLWAQTSPILPHLTVQLKGLDALSYTLWVWVSVVCVQTCQVQPCRYVCIFENAAGGQWFVEFPLENQKGNKSFHTHLFESQIQLLHACTMQRQRRVSHSLKVSFALL